MSDSTITPPKPSSALPTPALSAAHSSEVSPVFTEITSPALKATDLGLDLGVPAIDAELKEKEKEKEGKVPECWGHRGASAAFPENTRASFEQAIATGADGIETDIHITADNELVLFHDPELSRTTNGTGRIDNQPWHGVLEHVRTKKQPVQPIPMFREVLEIILRPGSEHVKLNMDCKVENDPVKLFTLMKSVIESFEGWETRLAPRIILGIWHPKYILPAKRILPFLPLYAISMSLPESRKYFFKHVSGFSIMYEALSSFTGRRFLQECREAGKEVCVWTVNDAEEMKECVRWGVKSIISDKPDLWRGVKKEILQDREKALQATLSSYLSPWLKKKNYYLEYDRLARIETEYLTREGGPFYLPDYDSQVIPVTESKTSASVLGFNGLAQAQAGIVGSGAEVVVAGEERL